MKRITTVLILLCILAQPVNAVDFTAPQAPDDALELIPGETSSFGEDLWFVIQSALGAVMPQATACAGICISLFAVVMLISLLQIVPGKNESVIHLAGVLSVAVLLLRQTNTMISVAAETVSELSAYGKLLLPVMTAALASQGGVSSSAALYAGTAVFDAILTGGISKVLVPMVYIYLVMATASAATGERALGAIRDFLKWLVTWCLKIILYIFTGYMSITGVVSGSVDAATAKAAKLTMSGMVPVVGGILSDASDAVIISAGMMKNAVGVYGVIALIAIWIAPFLRIGIQYLLLKLTAALCEIFDVKPVNELIKAFSSAMGLLLGMTGTVCVLQLISTVCFMKGVS